MTSTDLCGGTKEIVWRQMAPAKRVSPNFCLIGTASRKLLQHTNVTHWWLLTPAGYLEIQVCLTLCTLCTLYHKTWYSNPMTKWFTIRFLMETLLTFWLKKGQILACCLQKKDYFDHMLWYELDTNDCVQRILLYLNINMHVWITISAKQIKHKVHELSCRHYKYLEDQRLSESP